MPCQGQTHGQDGLEAHADRHLVPDQRRLTKAVGLTKGSQVLIKERLTFNGVECLELADPTNACLFIPAAQVAL